MNSELRIESLLLPMAIVLLAVLMRLLPHPSNVTPIGAMALFSGVYLSKRYAFVLPLLAMFFSDLFLGFSSSTLSVYISFILIGGIGLLLRKRKTVDSIIFASISSSVVFYLITNFGFWLTNDLYPKTLIGQFDAYIMALPFFRNTLLGDLFYTGLFFGGYEIVVRYQVLKVIQLFRVFRRI